MEIVVPVVSRRRRRRPSRPLLETIHALMSFFLLLLLVLVSGLIPGGAVLIFEMGKSTRLVAFCPSSVVSLSFSHRQTFAKCCFNRTPQGWCRHGLNSHRME